MKNNLIKHGLTAARVAVLAAALMAAGCVSSSKVNNAPTEGVGQQLIDLDRAYKEGIITEDQYNKLKKEVIKKND
jgi:hypothetical protein